MFAWWHRLLVSPRMTQWVTSRSRSTYLGSHPHSHTDCSTARLELGFLPQFTHLQEKSYSELLHRDVSHLKVSKTSNKMCICTISFYSFSFRRENTARHRTASSVLTQLTRHFHYQPSSLFPNNLVEKHLVLLYQILISHVVRREDSKGSVVPHQ